MFCHYCSDKKLDKISRIKFRLILIKDFRPQFNLVDDNVVEQQCTRKWMSYASKVCNEATTVVQAGPRMITSK